VCGGAHDAGQGARPRDFLVGHVTKDGAIGRARACSSTRRHRPYFGGEQHHAYRVLRAVKNRFGSTTRSESSRCRGRGLVGGGEPLGFFLSERPVTAGLGVVASLEARAMLLELQALVSRASFGTPRRHRVAPTNTASACCSPC